MEDLEKRKKTRKYHRGVTTRLLNKIQAELEKEPDDVDHRRLRLLETDLKQKATTLKSLDEEIFALAIDHGDHEACEKEAEESEDYKEKVAYSILTLKDTLKDENESIASGHSQASTR